MSIQGQTAKPGRRVGAPFSTLFELVRYRRQRSRNLAELKRLDGARLRDIGLSEDAAARIIGGI
jgi:uncharacterized protein YjiS (DUF1127 family)